MMQFIAPGRANDRIIVTNDRGVRLQEDDRHIRGFASHFARMIGVVLTDRNDLGTRNDRRKQANFIKLNDSPIGLNRIEQRVALQDNDSS